MKKTVETRSSSIALDRRSFMKSSASSTLLASIAGPALAASTASASRSAGPRDGEIFFTRDEYAARWERVQAAMAAAGYDNLLVWQRSAGTYDKIGDVYWLTNFQTYGTGQDPLSESIGEPYTFSAVLMRKGREPELHIGLGDDDIDVPRIFCGKIVKHEPHMIVRLADYLRNEKIDGRVAVVGDDILPGIFDRMLRSHTPQIEWVTDEQLLTEPQLVKSPRELEAYRVAGDLVSAALTSATEAMITGERACEAAARAAGILMRGGGGFHRISIEHGPAMPYSLSKDFFGYDTNAAGRGDLVTVWVYGPIFAGYWLDPGRTAICGKRPTPAQRTLIEDCASYVEAMVKAIKPGASAKDIGIRWAEIERKSGSSDSHAFGHGLGTGFPGYVLPVGDHPIGPFGYKRLPGILKPGMVLAAEAFFSQPDVGSVGFEQNFIVTDSGAEVLDKTPMLFW